MESRLATGNTECAPRLGDTERRRGPRRRVAVSQPPRRDGSFIAMKEQSDLRDEQPNESSASPRRQTGRRHRDEAFCMKKSFMLTVQQVSSAPL
ncbi:hypothetical protein EYF80_009846 [Liparis tanakae]|uniref:Uncharacterized protein n=1 Tax=Liparis tanakae TaxID=230148 RepID=A0A4Z2IP69_9TELE|nr:hypothetical protein EYF80_009846 [Liparis tanakae]